MSKLFLFFAPFSHIFFHVKTLSSFSKNIIKVICRTIGSLVSQIRCIYSTDCEKYRFYQKLQYFKHMDLSYFFPRKSNFKKKSGWFPKALEDNLITLNSVFYLCEFPHFLYIIVQKCNKHPTCWNEITYVLEQETKFKNHPE